MQVVILIMCSKQKVSHSCVAKDMYCSERFKNARLFAEQQKCEWYILSGKYGLLEPNTIIDPYDLSINELSVSETEKWANEIFVKFYQIYNSPRSIVLLANDLYSSILTHKLKYNGNKIFTPFASMSYEEQANYLSNAIDKTVKLKKFYEIVYNVAEKTGGIKLFKDCTGKQRWPKKGLYFIFDMSEPSIVSSQPYKIIRVGTHAVSQGAKSTLWNRLKTHKGLNNGGGSHRSSVFRLHVGNALINKNGLDYSSWSIGQSANADIRESEFELEKDVTDYIGNLGVVVFDIDDPSSASSKRAFIEKNAIALLSAINYSLDFASINWLGYYSIKEEIRKSSLWNINYVSSDVDADFLKILQLYADNTINNFIAEDINE